MGQDNALAGARAAVLAELREGLGFERGVAACRAPEALVEGLLGVPREEARAFLLEGGDGQSHAALLGGAVTAGLCTRNQFLTVTREQEARFVMLGRRLVTELGQALLVSEDTTNVRRQMRRALRRSRLELLRTVREVLPKPGPYPVVAAEYRPELQCELLGLEPERLLTPIVDLGCGRTAALVSYLRQKGLAATGLDRLAEAPRVLRRDWFEQPFAPRSIGTLISHQAFSLQFFHQHLASGPEVERYARKYRELLQALLPGGLFAYAPGLPFVERWLDPARFVCQRRALPPVIAERLRELVDHDTKESVGYVCHVTARKDAAEG